MVELLGLLEHAELWPVQPSSFVASSPNWKTFLDKRGRFYAVGECNRNKPLRTLVTIGKALVFALRERPHVLVTTGSMPLAIIGLFVRLFGGRVVWIDSIAQMECLSLSARLMRRIASVCLVQWPEVAAKTPGTEYHGELL